MPMHTVPPPPVPFLVSTELINESMRLELPFSTTPSRCLRDSHPLACAPLSVSYPGP